jgi:pyruvate dehydrogenase E1 component alpha subunit
VAERAVDPTRLDVIDREARARIERAVAEAEAAPLPDPATLADGVYAG